MILMCNYFYFKLHINIINVSIVEVKHEFEVTMKIFFVSKPKKDLLFDLQITLVLISDCPIRTD